MFIVEMNRYFAVYEKMRKLYTTIFFTIIHTQRSKPKIFQMKYKYLKLSLVTDNKHSKHSQFLLPSEHQLLPINSLQIPHIIPISSGKVISWSFRTYSIFFELSASLVGAVQRDVGYQMIWIELKASENWKTECCA